MSDADISGEWGAKIDNQADKTLDITVFTPPDCFVGKWDIKVHTVKQRDKKTVVFKYNHKERFYMLFNPWCRGMFHVRKNVSK